MLLSNDGVLPLDAGAVGSLAVIGPNADRAQIMGGGSAKLRAHYTVTPLEALRGALPVTGIRHERGCDIDRTAPELRAAWRIEFEDGRVSPSATAALLLFDAPTDGEIGPFTARARLTPGETGPHTFTLRQGGPRPAAGRRRGRARRVRGPPAARGRP